jgi:ribonucleoside-diphosphate reductase alpha chain
MDFGFRYRSGVHATQASFVDPAAVEAWDAWFRWRDGNELHDVTVDSTWSRVTQALCALETGLPARHEQLVGDAISSWRLLVDPRILAGAGRPRFVWPSEGLSAAINLARFVSLPFTSKAAFQRHALEATVSLAVRLIDNVRAAAPQPVTAPRLCVVGLADALAMLGLDYASEHGARAAAQIARDFARAVLDASCELARERGNRADTQCIDRALERASALGDGAELAQRIRRHGLRLAPLTALDAQPKLALVANNVADSISPLRGEKAAYVIRNADGERRITAAGFAITLWRQLGARADDTTFPFGTATTNGDDGVARIREAMAPWFDHGSTTPTNVRDGVAV